VTADTRQKSIVSPSLTSSGWRLPRRSPTPPTRTCREGHGSAMPSPGCSSPPSADPGERPVQVATRRVGWTSWRRRATCPPTTRDPRRMPSPARSMRRTSDWAHRAGRTVECTLDGAVQAHRFDPEPVGGVILDRHLVSQRVDEGPGHADREGCDESDPQRGQTRGQQRNGKDDPPAKPGHRRIACIISR
jgi:hypothetical protein